MRLNFIKYTSITLITLVMFITSTAAWAQCVPDKDDCIPGLPCNVCLTENEPSPEHDDGPNAELRSGTTPSPNEPKHGGSKACDADFMNQIYAQSFMQAQRSTTLSEMVIRKPDSILELSCFDQLASLAAVTAAPLFTESRQWDNVNVPIWGNLNKKIVDDVRPVNINTYMEDDRQDNSIREVVLKSLIAYLNGSFDHPLGGGAASGLPQTDTDSIDIFTTAYNCSFMNQIHFWSKCRNMNEDDPFFSFQDLTSDSFDPRLLPQECDAAPLIEEDIFNLARNEGEQYVAIDQIDNVYVDEMLASDTTQKCKDVKPIPTGLTFDKYKYTTGLFGTTNRTKTGSYEDHVCPKPGCYYDGTDCKE